MIFKKMNTRQKLDKCKKSLQAYVARGGSRSAQRGVELELRYDSLRSEALQNDEWKAYCEEHDLYFTHRGLDFFA